MGGMTQPEEQQHARAVRAANILLDIVSVWGGAEEDSTNADATTLAMARLNDLIDVTSANDDDETGRRITVNPMPVVTGAVLLLRNLIDGLVEASENGATAHDVIVTLRERLD